MRLIAKPLLPTTAIATGGDRTGPTRSDTDNRADGPAAQAVASVTVSVTV